MIKHQVRDSLLAKLKVLPPALSKRAKRLKENYGPMTTDEAVYVIAHMEGIDLSKHLPLETLDRVRSLVPKEVRAQSYIKKSLPPKKKTNIKKRGGLSYPLVKNEFFQKVLVISEETFPRVFILENSIRALIEKRLSVKQPVDWWPSLIPSEVIKSVNRVMNKEKRYPHREKRGNHPLMYCNFDDLRKIIVDPNNYPLFQHVIVKRDWFEVSMEEVYMARNNLAHSILLSEDDISTINLFYKRWSTMLESAGIV